MRKSKIAYFSIIRGNNFGKENATANSHTFAQLGIRTSIVVKFHQFPTSGLERVAFMIFIALSRMKVSRGRNF